MTREQIASRSPKTERSEYLFGHRLSSTSGRFLAAALFMAHEGTSAAVRPPAIELPSSIDSLPTAAEVVQEPAYVAVLAQR